MECNICINKFNKSKHKEIQCPSCHNSFCQECIENYIMSSLNQPDCMECKKEWNNEFLRNNMTKTFMNGKFKERQETILLEREKSYLPATQIYVENMINIEILQDKYQKLQEARDRITNDMHKVNSLIIRIKNNMDSDLKKDDTKRQFIQNCPATDCRGFLSTAWKCGTCQIWVCPECKEIKGVNKDAEHTCDPHILENAKAIEKETKPCPGCSASIFKINGCSAMFCVQCHVSFDWNTLKLITSGRLHNPHYFEWLNKTGGNVRNTGDIPCGGLPEPQQLANHLPKIVDIKNRTLILDICRIFYHITDVTARKYPTEFNVNSNRDLRVNYLRKTIDENEFKKQLQIREKKHNKCIAFRQIIDMFAAVIAERVRNIYVNIKKKNIDINLFEIEQDLQQINQLRDFTNTEFAKVGKLYSCTYPSIKEDWREVVSK